MALHSFLSTNVQNIFFILINFLSKIKFEEKMSCLLNIEHLCEFYSNVINVEIKKPVFFGSVDKTQNFITETDILRAGLHAQSRCPYRPLILSFYPPMSTNGLFMVENLNFEV